MWDSIQNVPYAFKGNQWISFDDIQSTSAKVLNLYGLCFFDQYF
jgi:hypothetical protein